tara:strand:- start:61 stop:1194 length:1134 start_codon:yes stop_codon:yes gene_type:complete
MILISRNDNSLVSRWWFTLDHWNLIQILSLAIIGTIIIFTSSPSVAENKGYEELHFFKNHILYMFFAFISILFTSFFSKKGIIRFGLIGFIISLLLLILVMFFGSDINGATRWLRFGVFSIQPSEFMKPFFVITTALILSDSYKVPYNISKYLSSNFISGILLFIVILFLLRQPDLGMSIIVVLIWTGQLFLAGLSLRWVVLMFGFLGIGVLLGYNIFEHVKNRIDCFFDISCKGIDQITNSFKAYEAGGLIGKGPGTGVIKNSISDAHTDFIFPVIAEEFGAIFCIIILLLSCSIVLRGFIRIFEKNDLFSLLTVGGMLSMFGIQVLLNVSVTLGLVPTTGVTFPFVSYGGSSLLSASIGMGIVLALTKKSNEIDN